jgi:probable HAF family extracellular repeat protein
MLSRVKIIVSSLAVVFSPATLHAQPGPGKFTFVPIPALPGGASTVAAGINNRGHVVGSGDVADGSSHGFIYDVRQGTLRDIGEGAPLAINDLDVAVGQSANGPAMFVDGQVIDLGYPPGATFALATSVNNEGVAVGVSRIRGDISLAVYAFGQAFAVDLGLGANVELTRPVPVINDDFQISGTLLLLDTFNFRAFRHDLLTGETTLLAPLDGDTDTWGLGINDRGEVLGYSFVFNAPEHIGTWDRHGKFKVHFTEGNAQYPTLSDNLVFNDREEIVISETTDGNSYVVPRVGHRFDLDVLVANLPATPQPLFSVRGINNGGVMTGYDFGSDFNTHGFVLVPLARDDGGED